MKHERWLFTSSFANRPSHFLRLFLLPPAYCLSRRNIFPYGLN